MPVTHPFLSTANKISASLFQYPVSKAVKMVTLREISISVAKITRHVVVGSYTKTFPDIVPPSELLVAFLQNSVKYNLFWQLSHIILSPIFGD